MVGLLFDYVVERFEGSNGYCVGGEFVCLGVGVFAVFVEALLERHLSLKEGYVHHESFLLDNPTGCASLHMISVGWEEGYASYTGVI